MTKSSLKTKRKELSLLKLKREHLSLQREEEKTLPKLILLSWFKKRD